MDGVAGQACQTTWTACYTYNALGQHAETQTGTTYNEFVYDLSGVELGRHDRSSTFLWQYLFLGSRRFGKYQDNKTYFTHENHLGTAGTVTDEAGATIQDVTYYPWGQQWNLVGTMKDQRFASLHHRDSETSLDPTHFRMFSSNQGRWFSTDPVHGRPCTPQSFNRYAYVLDNPGTSVDPLGLCCSVFDTICHAFDPCNNPYFRESRPQCSCGPPPVFFPPPRPTGGGGGGGGLTPHVYVWTGRVFSRTFGRYGIICHYSQDCPNGTTPSCSPSAFSLDVSIGLGCPKYMVEEGLYTVGGGGEKHCLAGIKYGTDKPKDCK